MERGHVRKRADQAAPRIPVPERERERERHAHRVAHGRETELRVPEADASHHSRILSQTLLLARQFIFILLLT